MPYLRPSLYNLEENHKDQDWKDAVASVRKNIPLVNYARDKFKDDAPTALAVLLAENRNLDPNIGNQEGSSARGLWQFMPQTWKEYGRGSIFDPYASTDAAKNLYDDRGWNQWQAYSRVLPGQEQPMYEKYKNILDYIDTFPSGDDYRQFASR